MLRNIQVILICAQYVPKVIKILQTKFQQYQDQNKAKQLYEEANQELSTIFQGDITLEQHKQAVFKQMEQIQKEIIEFLKTYNFQKLYNTENIKQKFFNEQENYRLIDLKEIAKDQFQIFTSELGTTNEVIWINKALNKINYILILYIQDQFKQLKKEEEFLLYFPEILEFNQTQILNRAKECLPKAYENIKILLEYICEGSIQKNCYLDNLVLEFQNNINLQLYQQKITEIYNKIIDNYNKDALEEIIIKYLSKENQETRNKFKISDVFLNEGHKIIRQRIRYKILNSLQNYKKRDHSILMKQIQNIIFKQVNQGQFVGGIQNKEINYNLQLIIFSIFWIQLGINKEKIEFLIRELEKYYEFENNIKDMYQIEEEKLEYNIDIKDKINRFKIDSQKALEWYNKNINEETNLLVICQIYMIMANFKFKNQKIYFGDYDSDARNILFIIVQNLNDLKYGYFNHEVLKICEILTHKIQIKLYKDINDKIQRELQYGENQSELFKQRSEIQIDNETYHLLLQDTSISILQSPSTIGREYHQKHQLFDCILKSEEPIQEFQKQQQLQLLQQRFQQIKLQITEKKQCNEYKFVNELEEPKLFQFQTLSTDENNSNVITLLISGFLSKNNNKLDQWKQLLKRYSGTVIVLQWDTKEFQDIIKQIMEWTIEQTKFEIIDQTLNKNQFVEATQEANKVGKFLAHFLDSGYLFGNRQINILCHSLGTEVLLECVHELDRFSKKKLINDIVLFGGVADIFQLSKRRWNSISGQVYNMYTDNDNILKYLFKFNYFFNQTCGLNPIKFGYKKIYNYDVSKIVDGHSDYWEKLDTLLNICDFNSDYKILVKNVQEKF